MGTAIKHPVPNRVKPSFAIFDIRALSYNQRTHISVKSCHRYFTDLLFGPPCSNETRTLRTPYWPL